MMQSTTGPLLRPKWLKTGTEGIPDLSTPLNTRCCRVGIISGRYNVGQKYLQRIGETANRVRVVIFILYAYKIQ